jgi:hypothetical protein
MCLVCPDFCEFDGACGDLCGVCGFPLDQCVCDDTDAPEEGD